MALEGPKRRQDELEDAAHQKIQRSIEFLQKMLHFTIVLGFRAVQERARTARSALKRPCCRPKSDQEDSTKRVWKRAPTRDRKKVRKLLRNGARNDVRNELETRSETEPENGLRGGLQRAGPGCGGRIKSELQDCLSMHRSD